MPWSPICPTASSTAVGSAPSCPAGPSELVHDALPVWRSLLRPGSAMALSWNTRTLSRHELIEALDGAGLEVVDCGDDAGFSHQVDRSIARDVIVARRSR